MLVDEAIKRRINELAAEKDLPLSALCLESNITPSTIFDFMAGRSKCPKVNTIKKLCIGAGITLKEFFDRDYFDSDDDLLK